MPIDQALLFDDVDDVLLLDDFQHFTATSDRSGLVGTEGLGFVLLGLFGEVGSLLSALKKKRRDKDADLTYTDVVLEEFGDVLWYLANVAGRVDVRMSDLAARAATDSHGWSYHGQAHAQTFSHLQATKNSVATSSQAFEARLLELAARTGTLLDSFTSGRTANNRDRLTADLIEVFRALIRAADDADISLNIAAKRNIVKAEGRWPRTRAWGEALDSAFPPEERFPTRMTFRFMEKKAGAKHFVSLELDGAVVGDTLTDNRRLNDDYRFHDVFHISHAAILGWSPTLRSMLKRKRKSNSEVDESEDGARAMLVEEGVASWIFNHAERAQLFRSNTNIDYGILKSVQQFVYGYEVDAKPLWQWECAILEGFRMFRLLKEHRGGYVTADLNGHTLDFSTEAPDRR